MKITLWLSKKIHIEAHGDKGHHICNLLSNLQEKERMWGQEGRESREGVREGEKQGGKKGERGKAHELKCWQLNNLEEGYIRVLCMILTNFLLTEVWNYIKIKSLKIWKIKDEGTYPIPYYVYKECSFEK